MKSRNLVQRNCVLPTPRPYPMPGAHRAGQAGEGACDYYRQILILVPVRWAPRS